jgi:hypothetical protein
MEWGCHSGWTMPEEDRSRSDREHGADSHSRGCRGASRRGCPKAVLWVCSVPRFAECPRATSSQEVQLIACGGNADRPGHRAHSMQSDITTTSVARGARPAAWKWGDDRALSRGGCGTVEETYVCAIRIPRAFRIWAWARRPSVKRMAISVPAQRLRHPKNAPTAIGARRINLLSSTAAWRCLTASR